MPKDGMKSNEIPTTFLPKFWEEADGRTAVVQEIRRRYETLKEDSGCDSYQKDLICQRAIFVGVQLETMERQATEGGAFNAGVYTQMSNALLGLLRAIGLERATREVMNLDSYVESKT